MRIINVLRINSIVILFLASNFIFDFQTLGCELLDEQNMEMSPTTKKAPFEKPFLPNEVLEEIFKSHSSLLPKILQLNCEWNKWAQPIVSGCYKLFLKIVDTPEKNLVYAEKNAEEDFKQSKHGSVITRKIADALDAERTYKTSKEGAYILIFDLLETQIKQRKELLRAYLTIRRSFCKSIKFKIQTEKLFKENPSVFRVSTYQNKDTIFSLPKLIRAWSELQIHESAIGVIRKLLTAQESLQDFIEKGPPQNSLQELIGYEPSEKLYAYLRVPFRYGQTYGQEAEIACLIDAANQHKQEFSLSRVELSKIIFHLVELEKMCLIASNMGERFYSNFPTYEVMKIFQETPFDVDNNSSKLRQEKFDILKQEILEFAKKHYGPAEFYVEIIKRQLLLG